VPSEPAFAIPPRSEPVFSPAANAEPFLTPPPRTEQVITPRTEQAIRTGPRPESPATTSSENGPLFQERPKRQSEIYSGRSESSAPAQADKLTPGDVELIARIDRERSDETLRARIHEGERRRLGIDEQAQEEASSVSIRYRAQAASEPEYVSESRFEWGPALWRMRFAIIGVLVLLVGAYAFIFLRTGGAPTLGGPQAQGTRVVNIGTRFTAPGWEFVADGVTRVDAAGNVRARGVFVIVRVTASNKALVDSQLGLGSFTLIDARGVRYAPETISSGVHQGGPNAGAAYSLGSELVSGRTVAITLVFDVDPSITRGLILQITEAPNVTLKLD
ncbi:MAG: DUF4352 domain-containing protein, partial [Chloroflexota bacterium]|nr:DUF4352 domain-containing protein [Chloroflexota bacterium]